MNQSMPEKPEELKDLCLSLQCRVQELEEMVRLLRHNRFGRSSEKFDYSSMRSLFPDVAEQDKNEGKKPEEREIEVKPHKRKVSRKPFPDDIEREEVIIDVETNEKTCSDCSCEMHKVGEKISEKLHLVPAKLLVKKYIRPVYSCRSCEKMANKPMPYHPIKNCSVTVETLAHLITSKFADGMPLYRLEQILKRQGVDIKRDKMSRWVIALAEKCETINDLCHRELLKGGYIFMDETRLQVNKEKGRAAHQKSYMIVQAREGPPGQSIVLFHYEPSRSSDTIKKYLKDFQGYLTTDGLEVYQTFSTLHPGIIHGGCLSHARRKFDEAIKGNKKKNNSTAAQFLNWINKIFAIEREAKGLSGEGRLKLRQEKSRPIVAELERELNSKITKIPKKSLTGKALHYFSNQWDYLTRFLDHPDMVAHNNFVENHIRPYAVGRKAWLFADTTGGANASAIFFSLAAMAKQNGLNFYDYLCHILHNLESPPENLLPFKS